MNTMTQCMAIELARDNIRVNSVCPVAGATALLEQFMGRPDTPEARAPFLATIPLGRLSTPADIANACLWLAEDFLPSSPAFSCPWTADGRLEAP